MTWIARALLIVAGLVASWFVARDALNFSVIQGVIAMVLFALAVLAATFWPPEWTAKFNRLLKR